MTDDTDTDHYVETVEETAIDDVRVRRIATPKGERLEVSADGDAIRIDALGLESLSWQDRDVFSEFLGHEYAFAAASDPEDEADEEIDCEFTLSNEYADVVVRSVRSPDGDRLVVEAPKKQFSLRIDPEGLRGLARQDTSIFTEFLETPHGPGGHAH